METRVDPRVDGVKIKVLSSHGSKMNDYLAHSLKAISREYGGIKIFLETMTLSDIRDDPQWWNMQNITNIFPHRLATLYYVIRINPRRHYNGLLTSFTLDFNVYEARLDSLEGNRCCVLCLRRTKVCTCCLQINIATRL